MKGVRRKEYRGTLAPPSSLGVFFCFKFVEGKAPWTGRYMNKAPWTGRYKNKAPWTGCYKNKASSQEAAKGSQNQLNSGNAPVQGSHPLSHQMTLWGIPCSNLTVIIFKSPGKQKERALTKHKSLPWKWKPHYFLAGTLLNLRCSQTTLQKAWQIIPWPRKLGQFFLFILHFFSNLHKKKEFS